MKDDSKKYQKKDSGKPSHAEEIFVPYRAAPLVYMPEHEEGTDGSFTYSSFKVLAERSPFTLHEWAKLLYMSERTLHRYANEEAPFNGLQVDRILLLEQLINTGNELLGEKEFKRWVFSTPYAMRGESVFDTLFSARGIRYAIDMLHRIQHGIPL